ncbi:hypothetical protein ACVW07_000308 [Cellulomonas sp. URHB0016]
MRREVVPELARELELLVDRDGLRDVDGAVRALGRVVQLAERGVPGARVVPRVRALLRGAAAALVDLHRPGGLKRREERGERGAHDPAADEDDVHLIFACWHDLDRMLTSRISTAREL